jgi:aldose sugar dehydrogenase
MRLLQWKRHHLPLIGPNQSMAKRRLTMRSQRLISRRALLGAGAASMTGLTIRPSLAMDNYPSSAGALKLEEVANGLENPWGFSFLPDGAILVTERPGRLRMVEGGRLSEPVAGLPEVEANGQGGLLDVALDPKFSENNLIYWSYAEPRDGGNGTAIARGRLMRDAKPRIEGPSVIFRQMPTVDSNKHFGSRLAFAADSTLFATLGERYSQRAKAQVLDNHLGKVIRINADGSVPADNPFAGRKDALPEIWSYGHRNPQSAAINPATGELWTVEHGARGGDEVNIPRAGKNYGWPVITYGRDYSGAKIGEGTAKAGMEQPIHYWDPSIAPSGMAFYTGDVIPEWKGSLFVGALAGMMLVRLTLEGNKVTGEERLFQDLDERIRDVLQGPDGALYIATDNDPGRILRVSRA